MQYVYVDTQSQLQAVCEQFSQATQLCLDTEFVRTKTYFPQLGLIQICDRQLVALIDPLAVNDLLPFWQLLAEQKIEKVIHAGSEDLDIFVRLSPLNINNIIDSQILMAFMGHGLSLGYAAMVEHYAGVELDKSESRTDWLKRPLTAKQIDYAKADVIYLQQIIEIIKEEVENAGWLAQARAECQRQLNKKYQTIDPDKLYLEIKLAWQLHSAALNRLKHLAKWRYQQAIAKNKPISFIAKDNTLFYIAKVNPSSYAQLFHIAGVDEKDARYQGKAMLAVIAYANEVDEGDFPEAITRLDKQPNYKQFYKQIKLLLEQLANEYQLPAAVLYSKKQINQVLTAYYQGSLASSETVDLLNNWRGEICRKPLLALLCD